MNRDLDLQGELPAGRLVIEASAGTGKTYSLSALVARHVAERNRAASELLLVTYTRAAAAELRDRTRAVLVAAEDALTTGVVLEKFGWMQVLLDADEDEVAERRRRVAEAVRSFDDATITTIHGFCQLALRQLGLRSGAAVDTELTNHQPLYVEEVCRDLVLPELYRDARALDWPPAGRAVSSVLDALKKSVSTVLGNRGIRIVPDATATPDADDTPGRLELWVDLVQRAARLVGERQRAKQEMGYDELINGLHDAVTDPVTGPDAVATLRSRYQLVLVDEFQDTDAVQWEMFARVFGDRDLVTVGDPKQAIYSFRGADVRAYLDAVDGVEGTRRLGVNRRSDPSLVRATNALLGGVRLGHERIAVDPVDTPDGAVDAMAGAPLRIRHVPPDPSVCNNRGQLQAGKADKAIIDDIVRVAVDLFDHETITTGDDSRHVSPGDVAVLVRSNEQAKKVVEALVTAGIPAVRARTGSVLTSEAVDDLDALLAALEQPSRGGLVRNAGLGVFVGCTAAELDPSPIDPDAVERNEERFAELQRRFAHWADRLTRGPFLAWYDVVRAESGVAARVLAHPMGERRLTDLDHLAELLGAELGGMRTTAASARRMLDRLRLAADDDDTGPQMRRIDSDARAVQVSTVHGSKGLEYPVVLLPFGWKEVKTRSPYVYHPSDGVRTVDIASGHGWTGTTPEQSPDARQHLAKVGDLGDDLRLLYVALTRAQHRSVVWWAPFAGGSPFGLSKVLFDRDADGEPRHSEPSLTVAGETATLDFPQHTPADPAAVDAALAAMVARGRDADGRALIDVEPVPLGAPKARWVEPAPKDAPPVLAAADRRGRGALADPAWRRWSFTGITKDRHDVWVPAMPVVGGTDEPEDDAGSAGAPVPDMPWATLGGGTAFGTLVHEVLEHVDPTSVTLDDDLTALVAARSSGGSALAPVDDVVRGLAAAVRTPMGPIADGRSLADIAVTDRLAELDFDMPLSTGLVIGAPQIGEVLLATLPADDPQLAYAHELANGRFGTDLKGYLAGSIDAVLRLRGADGDRFVVVDYKTNRLHRRDAASPLEAYHPDALPDAMADADYPLQSLLYSVALHRFLRWRLGAAYRPEQHLGGIAYLFLRGMVGPATPTADGRTYGVFAWRPPAAAVEALDRLLATGGVE